MSARSEGLGRLWVPLGTFGAVLLAGSAFAATMGGVPAFRSMLEQGVRGPLVPAMAYGSVPRGPTLIALALLTSVAACTVNSSKWTLVLSLLAAIAWPVIGWSGGF